MRWTAYFQEGWQNLLSAKLRSILALTGILVGTASVVAMISGGEMATNEALKQFKTLGTDLLAITISESSDKLFQNATQKSLSVEQAKAISDSDHSILEVAPYIQLYNPIQFNGHALDGAIVGVTESFARITHIEMAEGRFISDLDHYEPFCVIGDGLYQQIKQHTLMNPVGQQIQVGSAIFTIAGVAKYFPENSFVDGNVNNAVILPIEAAFLASQYAVINNIVLKLSENASSDRVEVHVENYLRHIFSGKQYAFRSAKELVKRMGKQNEIFTVFLGLIGGVSLLVGGIGVMNIMLVSVVERRREMGIRMAVGATRRDIRLLFLVEAVILAMAGGLLGVLLGIVIAYGVALYWHWEFTIFLWPPLVGFTVSVATGVFFGFYPAHQASRLNPVVALRAD